MKKFAIILLGALAISNTAYAENQVNMKPKTPHEWREYLYYRRDEVFDDLFQMKPEAKQVIDNAEGYAVFVNFSVKILFVGGGSGRGFVHDNKTGEDLFMRMAQADVGLGLGAKDFRAVFVFDDRTAMENFKMSGWSFGTEADAAAKMNESGDAASGALRIAPGIRVYQLTENGLALQATLTGTKYWRDDHVNQKLKF